MYLLSSSRSIISVCYLSGRYSPSIDIALTWLKQMAISTNKKPDIIIGHFVELGDMSANKGRWHDAGLMLRQRHSWPNIRPASGQRVTERYPRMGTMESLKVRCALHTSITPVTERIQDQSSPSDPGWILLPDKSFLKYSGILQTTKLRPDS